MVSWDRFGLWLEVFESELNRIQLEIYKDSGRLHSACRYALAGRGKRIRPLLAMAAAEACGRDWRLGLTPGLSLEFIHTYSLVHDDLPCMDNDDLRRGRATTHKVFDEATALLAGDALLTDAFSLLLRTEHLDAREQLELIRTLSEAAGGQGMVFGQDLDMHWTGREGYAAVDLDRIHNHKTGALIAAACTMGGIAAEARPDQRQSLQSFGQILGLSFQIIDDLLDDSLHTGKSKGKDQQAGKLTYLSLMDPAAAAQRSKDLTQKALDTLTPFGPHGDSLRHLALLLLERQV